MRPVWIKYYGIVPMTKRGYLVTLGVVSIVLILILVVGHVLAVVPPISTLWQPDPVMAQRGFFGMLYNYTYWILLVCLVAQGIDTYITLRVFAQKEAEQREMYDEDEVSDA